jgi:hypothetical protein
MLLKVFEKAASAFKSYTSLGAQKGAGSNRAASGATFVRTGVKPPEWRPQAHDDPDAWGRLIFQPKLDDRIRGYRTEADGLFGEIIRYAISSDENSVGDLFRLYQRVMCGRLPPEIRRRIYRETATAQQREPAVISCNAYLPFIFCETADSVVSSATIDYVSLADLVDGDPMSRVKEVIDLIKRGSIANRGAAFGALLFIGDRRVSELLLPLRDQLKGSEVAAAMRTGTGYISAASIEFLIDWLEGTRTDVTNGLFGTVASGLVNVRKRAESPLVLTGLRAFPVTGVAQEEQLRMACLVDIDYFIDQIAPRLIALERKELEPKIMPFVLDTWGIPSSIVEKRQ